MRIEILVKGGIARSLELRTELDFCGFHPAFATDAAARDVVLVLWAETNRAVAAHADAWFGPDAHGNMVSVWPGELAGFVVEPRTAPKPGCWPVPATLVWKSGH